MVLLSNKEGDFQLAIANRVTRVSLGPLTNLSGFFSLKRLGVVCLSLLLRYVITDNTVAGLHFSWQTLR